MNLYENKRRYVRNFIFLFILSFSYKSLCANCSQGGKELTLNLKVESQNTDIYTIDNFQYRGRCDVKNVIFHDSLLVIGISAFQGCINLTDLIFPKSCEEIMDSAFYGCESLRKVKLPESLKSIGVASFQKCYNLRDVVIPEGCKSIHISAFDDCDSLKSIRIPSSVTFIDDYAFPIKTKLIVGKKSIAEIYAKKMGMLYEYDKSISHNKEIEDITLEIEKEGYNNDMNIIEDYQYSGRIDVREIKFPKSLLSIGVSAFEGCLNIVDLKIPDRCEKISENAFYGCESLQSIKLPNSLKVIGSAAFKECTSLMNVTIPEGCTEIGDQAFEKCLALQTVKIPTSVIDIGTDMHTVVFPPDVLLIVDEGSYAERYARKFQIDFVYRNQIKNVIGPILKTQWNQPLDFFYGKDGKYGEYKYTAKDGICYIIAFGQIFKHLGMNISGSRSYATSDNVYYKDFEKNKIDINRLPLFWGRNSESNLQLCEYIDNLAIAEEHGWKGEEIDAKIAEIKEHVPVKLKYHHIKTEGRSTLESLIRENLEKNIPLYAILSGKPYDHAAVIDGIRENDHKIEVHLNMGWGRYCNRWSTLQSSFKIESQGYEFYGIDCICEIIPLDNNELNEWKAFHLTEKQLNAINNETRHTAEISNDTLYIPEGTRVIPPYHNRFINDSTIKHICFPSTLQSLQNDFINGTNVEELYIPQHVKILSQTFFKGMKKLKKLYYNSEEKTICENCLFENCDELSVIEFGSNVKYVPSNMLCENNTVKQIIWAKNIEYIGKRAFYQIRVKSLELTSNVIEIEDYAFYSDYLEFIFIPSSVQKIGNQCVSKKTTIRCEENSYAYKWAKMNNMKIEIVK